MLVARQKSAMLKIGDFARAANVTVKTPGCCAREGLLTPVYIDRCSGYRYGASKAAVKLFTEGLHSELKNTNIGVTVVFPGAIATNIALNSGVMTQEQQESGANSGYKTTPADVAARAMVDGMETRKYRVLIGSDAKMMDFLYRLMPEGAARIIYNQMKNLLPQ